jgi:hypothetical protein
MSSTRMSARAADFSPSRGEVRESRTVPLRRPRTPGGPGP